MKARTPRKVTTLLVLKVFVVLVVISMVQAGAAPLAYGQSSTCTDSDGGLNYEVAGYVQGIGPSGWPYTKYDTCDTGAWEGYLREYTCSGGVPSPKFYACPSGCVAGACKVAGGWTSAMGYPWGTQMWSYNWQAMVTYSHPGCMMGVPSLWLFGPPPPDPQAWPSLMAAFEAMNAACDHVGLTDSAFGRLTSKAANLISHGVPFEYVAYGPEGTSGVPPAEANPANLLAYARKIAAWSQANGKMLVYGPSTELMALEWEPGRQYVLDANLIRSLAAALPDGSVWFIRPFQFEIMFHSPVEFRAAVQELVGYIHEGNPDLVIWAQLLLSPYRSGADFLEDREALVGVVDATYMEIAGPSTTQYHPGTLAAMEAVWQATRPQTAASVP